MRGFLVCALLCLLGVTSVATAESKQDPQAEAEALLNRAREISDIRGPKSPPFILKATFSVISKELENFQGTYAEFWVSDSQWRREITVKNSQKVEVATATRLWVLENDDVKSSEADRVSSALSMFPARSSKLMFESVGDIKPNDSSVRCAVTKPAGEDKAKHGYCFDSRIGVLVEHIAPELLGFRVGDYSCGYDNFEKFGDLLFPRDVDCRIEGHRKMQLHVSTLSSETLTDASLFNPPSGALEIGRCPAGGVPPKPDFTPDPNFPAGQRGSTAAVVVSVIIGVNGKTQDVRVIHSAGKAFDDMAVGTIKRWKFRPAACNGDPMPFRTNIEIKFRSYVR